MIDKKRRIVHIDMDAFFASVEQRDNPRLKGKPIAVGGGGKRGVVAAASYEARAFGVRSAMPGPVAQRLCPELIFCKPRFDVYKKDSQIIRKIFRENTSLVEPLSLDEAYLDLTHLGASWDLLIECVVEIKERIVSTTALTASAGCSFNKFIAKTASGMNKPDGLTVVKPDAAITLLEKLPIGAFYGIGKVTAEKMRALGIQSGADLKSLDKMQLALQFGKHGTYYYNVVRGIDNREVKPNRVRKSLSVERTYADDLKTNEALDEALQVLAEELETRLIRAQKMGRTITLKVRYFNFDTFTRQMTTSASSPDHRTFKQEAFGLLQQLPHPRKPIRLLGLGISNFHEEDYSGQLALFGQ